MRKFFIVLILCSLLFATSLFAQFDFGLNGTIIAPQGGFKENVDRLGIGLTGKIAVRLGEDSPFYAGLTIGGGNYGSETRRETLVWPVRVDVETNNNILFSHLLFQVRTKSQPIQPYVEGLFGFNYLWTESKIKDIDEYDDDIASETHFDDFALSYGGGFGILIRLKSFDIEGDFGKKKEGRLFLDLKVRYMAGGEAEYLKEGALYKGENDEVLYKVNKSKTDFVSYHLGVVFRLF